MRSMLAVQAAALAIAVAACGGGGDGATGPDGGGGGGGGTPNFSITLTANPTEVSIPVSDCWHRALWRVQWTGEPRAGGCADRPHGGILA